MMLFKLIKYYISLLYWNRQPVEKVRAMQLRKFKEVFEYARDNSPFYKDLYSRAGVMDLDIKTWDDVQKVPIVDKDEYRKVPLEYRMTMPFNPKVHNIETTSGSSGNPLQIAYEKWVDYTGHIRVLYMLMKVAHYTPFTKIFMIARFESDAKFSVEKDVGFLARVQKLFHLFQREIVSIYEEPDYMINRILKSRPSILWTTPSALEMVVNKLILRNEKLNVPYLFLTSENVSEIQYNKFRTYVSPVIVDLFGAMESPSISYDVNRSGKSRVFVNASVPEFINHRNDGGKKVGTLLVTSLLNKSTPFIRYNLKDYGEILDTSDFPNKYIGPVVGRMDDILTFPDGSFFFHHIAHELYMDFIQCLQFKFVQIGNGPIILQLLPNPDYDEKIIIEEAQKRWNRRFPNYPLRIEFVQSFKINSKTGKFKNIEKITEK